MKRRVGVALSVLAVALVGASLWLAPRGAASVPTLVLEARPFEVRVAAEGFLRAVRAVPIAVPADARPPLRLAWMLPDGAEVEAGQVVLRFEAEEASKERRQAQYEVRVAELDVEKQGAKDAAALTKLERDARLTALEAELAGRFTAKDEEIFSRREIVESQLDQELATRRQRHAEAEHASELERSRLDRRLLDLKRARGERQLTLAEQSLASLEVVAPAAGLFVFQRGSRGQMPRVGDTVWASQPIAEIPDLSAMEAEVFVLEADAGRLAAGKPATIWVESSPERPVTGVLSRVGSLAQPLSYGSPVQYFSAVVALDQTLPELMRPGQRVRAELALARLESALAVPLQAVFEEEGKKVVLRRERGAFVPVPVELGEVGGGQVVVSAGLAAGDEIALLDPRPGARKPASFDAPASQDEGAAGPGGRGRGAGPRVRRLG
jgi:HlyD family secretion protein